MAIEGKKRFNIYLDDDNYQTLKKHLDTRPGAGGVSAILDKHLARCADIVRKNEKKLAKIKPGKLTLKKFFQIANLDVDFKKSDFQNDL